MLSETHSLLSAQRREVRSPPEGEKWKGGWRAGGWVERESFVGGGGGCKRERERERKKEKPS